MKRYLTILSALFTSFLVFGIFSCNKDNKPQTLFSNMLGNWTKTASATDDNGSGIITQGEIYPQVPNTVEVLVFKADTTGYDSTVVNHILQSVLPFHWYLNGDSLTIQYAAHDTPTYYIENINSDNLTLYYNSPTGLAAYYYNK